METRVCLKYFVNGCSSAWVSRQQGLKKARKDGKTYQNHGRNVGSKINRDIDLLTRHKNGEVKSYRKIEKLDEKFRIH